MPGSHIIWRQFWIEFRLWALWCWLWFLLAPFRSHWECSCWPYTALAAELLAGLGCGKSDWTQCTNTRSCTRRWISEAWSSALWSELPPWATHRFGGYEFGLRYGDGEPASIDFRPRLFQSKHLVIVTQTMNSPVARSSWWNARIAVSDYQWAPWSPISGIFLRGTELPLCNSRHTLCRCRSRLHTSAPYWIVDRSGTFFWIYHWTRTAARNKWKPPGRTGQAALAGRYTPPDPEFGNPGFSGSSASFSNCCPGAAGGSDKLYRIAGPALKYCTHSSKYIGLGPTQTCGL